MDPTLTAWRKQQRAALLAQRQTLDPAARRRTAEAIMRHLDTLLSGLTVRTIGLYWPIQYEPNLLSWARALAQRGVTLALPVVVARGQPLEYWRWHADQPMGKGIWDIPIPSARDVLLPDLVLAPLVGFDAARYRLGYGGGYFDRTLARLAPRPLAIGIGYDFAAIETIQPQPHDIPMDAILTEGRADIPTTWRHHAA
ncbi:MAG: 5-formyltetrahydrofolate cyclo-ligase [Acetobacteraceae bacterium]